MRHIILLFALFAFINNGCKKKEPFKLEAESVSFNGGAEIFDNGMSGISVRLRDASKGFGESVKISIAGLPAQVTAKMSPDSNAVVTDAGINIYLSFLSQKAVVDAIYPIILNFTWNGGSSSREVKLRVVRYNAARALTGKYGIQGGCDTNGNDPVPYQSEVALDTGINRILICNLNNLGDEFVVTAQMDTTNNRVIIPQQTINDIKVQGEGIYNQSFMSLNCTFVYPWRITFCSMQLRRIVM